jgi:hypothetical protein
MKYVPDVCLWRLSLYVKYYAVGRLESESFSCTKIERTRIINVTIICSCHLCSLLYLYLFIIYLWWVGWRMDGWMGKYVTLRVTDYLTMLYQLYLLFGFHWYERMIAVLCIWKDWEGSVIPVFQDILLILAWTKTSEESVSRPNFDPVPLEYKSKSLQPDPALSFDMYRSGYWHPCSPVVDGPSDW